MDQEISLQEFKMLIDLAQDGYMVADGNGVVLYHNQAYQRAIDNEMEDMVGRNMQDFIERGDIKRSSALMAIEQKKKISMLTVIKGNHTAYVTSTPILDENGNVTKVLTQARDTTELNELKQQIRQLEEHANKMELEGEGSQDYGQGIVVVSSKMRGVFELAAKVKNVGTTVMLLGESGVGKDVVAQFIHRTSAMRDKPFIAVNCNALSEQLLETELFGYVGGSFTGASKEGKKGLFEAAQDGVLFLDEIGDISPNLQVKLLRAIETKTITRVGDYKTIPVNVRIITATNRNLQELVQQGLFREDLYYRLNVVCIPIPPLRERRDDISPLVLYYLNRYNNMYNMVKRLGKEVLAALKNYRWPGNIRELKNVVERLVVTSEDDMIQMADLSFSRWSEEQADGDHAGQDISVTVNRLVPLEQAVECVERKLLCKAKNELRTSRRIAKELAVSRATISRKLNKYQIEE